MAFTFKETKALEKLKQKHKLEIIDQGALSNNFEHDLKMKRLEMMLKIAKAGGVKGE